VASRVIDDHKENKRLASYFVAEKGVHIPISDLRKHLAERLPSQQLPHYLIQLDEIPLTVSGKVAINQLPPPETVRPPLSNEYIPPADELEKLLVTIWEEQIGISGIGVTDDFFEVGGDSLIGALVFANIHEDLGKDLPASTLLKSPTIREQAELIRRENDEQKFSPVITVNAEGDRTPLFFIPGKGGYPTRIRHLAKKIDPQTPIYALQDLVVDQPRLTLRSVESIAAFFLSEVKKLYSQGPYILLGESFGGLVAYEMAQQLLKAGEDTPILALLDSKNQTVSNGNSYLKENRFSTYRMWLKKHYTILRKSDWQGRKDYLQFYWETGGKKVRQFVGKRAKGLRKEYEQALPESIRKNEQTRRRSGFAYRAQSYPGRVILFKAMLGSDSKDATNGWNKVSLGELVVYPLDCYHGGILFEPAVSRVAEVMQGYIEKSSR
jgi:thioesterase domain-containing protein